MRHSTATVRTDYSPTSPRLEKRWAILKNDDAGAKTMQRESSAIQKQTTNGKCPDESEERRGRADHPGELPVVEAKSGEGHGLRGKAGRKNAERLVLTRGEMKELPPGVFEAELVRRYAIEDPTLKRRLRGCEMWKGA